MKNTKACHFCLMNWANLQRELDDAMTEWALNKNDKNMVRCAKAGKLIQEWVLNA